MGNLRIQVPKIENINKCVIGIKKFGMPLPLLYLLMITQIFTFFYILKKSTKYLIYFHNLISNQFFNTYSFYQKIELIKKVLFKFDLKLIGFFNYELVIIIILIFYYLILIIFYKILSLKIQNLIANEIKLNKKLVLTLVEPSKYKFLPFSYYGIIKENYYIHGPVRIFWTENKKKCVIVKIKFIFNYQIAIPLNYFISETQLIIKN